MNEVLKTIENRRSIRAYKPEQIKQEELDLLSLQVFTPSGHKVQETQQNAPRRNYDVVSYIR